MEKYTTIASYEIGFVLLSTFRQFLLELSHYYHFFFFEILHGVRSLQVGVLDRAEFSRKNPHWTKMTKNGGRTLWANFHSSLVLLCVLLGHAETSHLALNCSKLTGWYMICKNAQNVKHFGYWLRMCHSLCHLIFYIIRVFCDFLLVCFYYG